MEKSGNIEDQVTDHLLRSYIKQQRPPEANCHGFDPDLASLYLERVLAEKEASRYEIHLFECSPCRNSVIALARFAEQETPIALLAPVADNQTLNAAIETEQKTVVASNVNWLGRLKVFLGVFAVPRFALGAVAAIVLAISIPIVISQKGNNALTPSEPVAETSKSAEGEAPNVIAKATPPSSEVYLSDGMNRNQGLTAGRSNSGEPESANSQSPGQTGAATGAASGGSGAPTPAAEVAPAKDNKKEEAKSDAATVAENQPRANDTAAGAGRASEPLPTVASAPAPAPKVAEKRELPRIDTKETLRVPENDKDAAARTIKPGRSDGSVATAEKPTGATIRPGDASAQPPATATEPDRRTGVTDKGKSLRAESDVRKERARPSASRKIENKTFWLIDDVWTDKDYKKDKELPVVTLIKESDLYREVLAKRSSLQKFFTGFAANEKIIVVYKGTVYRLMPRDGN